MWVARDELAACPAGAEACRPPPPTAPRAGTGTMHATTPASEAFAQRLLRPLGYGVFTAVLELPARRVAYQPGTLPCLSFLQPPCSAFPFIRHCRTIVIKIVDTCPCNVSMGLQCFKSVQRSEQDCPAFWCIFSGAQGCSELAPPACSCLPSVCRATRSGAAATCPTLTWATKPLPGWHLRWAVLECCLGFSAPPLVAFCRPRFVRHACALHHAWQSMSTVYDSHATNAGPK